MKKEEKVKLEEFMKEIRNLDSFVKIQDFLSSLQINFEENGETCRSPFSVLRTKKAHCIEGAFFAAATIWLNKLGKPLVVDLVGEKGDWDHVICVFKKHGKFGCISKTNHSVLRYREPVYANIHELVMSFFHEYSDDKGNGRKTLRKYSDTIDLSSFGKEWIVNYEDLWGIHDYIDSVKHYDILSKSQIRELRKQEQVEIDAGQVVQFKK